MEATWTTPPKQQGHPLNSCCCSVICNRAQHSYLKNNSRHNNYPGVWPLPTSALTSQSGSVVALTLPCSVSQSLRVVRGP
jgi:hypothetical protein